MEFEYKKPGAWLWTRHKSASLEQDLHGGVLQTDWRYRIPTGESPPQFRECTLEQLLYIEAVTAYQKQPLPAPAAFQEPISQLGLLLARYINRYVGINYRDTKNLNERY